MKPSTEWWRYLAPLAVIAIIALLPVPAGLENHTWLYFAVFTGVIVGLILEPVPGAVVAMVGISIIAILSPWLLFSPEQLAQPGFKFTAKSLSWAVSGFSNSVIWLIFAAFMFGTGYEKTGLGRRIALILVKKMGHRTLFLGYAVMFSTRRVVRGLSIPSSVTCHRSINHNQTTAVRAALARTSCGWGLLPTA